MADEGNQLSYGDYLKAAFLRSVRVPLLGRMPLNQMGIGVFLVAGLLNPGFWLLGLALELGLVFGLSSSKRFQRLVEAERRLAAQENISERIHNAVERLSVSSRARYRALLDQCRRIIGVSDALGGDTLGDLRHLQNRNLQQMLWIFLRLLTSREMIAVSLKGLDERVISGEIAQLEARLESAAADSALARSLQGTIDIQRKRLDNLDRARTNLEVIDAELGRIEQQVELLREEAAVSGKPELLTARLDAVTSTMSDTSRWMDEHSELLGTLSDAPEGNLLADLPTMPQELER